MDTKQKVWKLGQKGRGQGQVAYFWISEHLIVSGYDEATNVKFCRRIESKEY